MNYLLDTHVVVWLADGSSRLKSNVIDVLQDYGNSVYFSPINIWEIAIKQSQGSGLLHVDIDMLHDKLLQNDYQELSIKSSHAKLVKHLPAHHKDPFDRMLIAQALSEHLCLVTHDGKIWQYDAVDILKA